MLTFCRRAASRAGVLLQRRRALPHSTSSTSSSSDHDYLALHLPDPPPPPSPSSPPSSDPSATPEAASVDDLAARLRQRRRGRPGQESVIAASFGVIRLDSDNRPVVHGQFEPGLFDGEADGRDPELAEAMADRQTPDRLSWNERHHEYGIDNINDLGDLNDDVGGGTNSYTNSRRNTDSPQLRSGGHQKEQPGGDAHLPDAGRPVTAAAAATSPSDCTILSNATSTTSPLRPATSYVDDQYFPETGVGGPGPTDPAGSGPRPVRAPVGRIQAAPEGPFEEQYFAEAFQSPPPALSVSSPLHGPERERRAAGSGGADAGAGVVEVDGGDGESRMDGDGGGGVAAGGGGKVAGRPEGVFEEQYFWAAFEDTDEQGEVERYKAGLAAKYSPRDVGDPRDVSDQSRVSAGDPVSGSMVDERQEDTVGTHRRRGDGATGRDAGRVAAAAAGQSLDTDSRTEPAASAATGSRPRADRGTPPQPGQQGKPALSSPAGGRRSALDVVREMRAAAAAARAESANRGRQLRAELTDVAALPSSGVLALLRRGVLHDADDFVVLYKPSGLAIHSSTERHPHCLTDLLPALARHVHCDQLLTVHRLDRDTSGVLLLAKTTEAARRISDLLQQGRVLKTYWAVVRGEPDLPRGVVDIPVLRTVVGGRERMGLPSAGGGQTPPGAQRAVTRYRVLSRGGGCSLLELSPATGAKHQLRVHLGLGLGCPVVGDHKYSRWDTASRPQRLPPAALAALGLRAPEARHLPLHLHARALWLPGLERRVTAPLPLFFKRNLRRLKMATGKVKADGSNYGKDD